MEKLKKDKLRPVEITTKKGSVKNGYFHRFVYVTDEKYSAPRVLIELTNGKLTMVDPDDVKFTDRE
ncbi:hypothetical protein [Mangrovivirga cuniculi]|uniref:Uncharacterized protein n=1 Tax=Mangrovivirga cuniculi TaxID=2715131 RepID=A0A4D7JSX1_9BACT|nr:hypothetical protein [Mangrovivirga cuniculi]QCK15226.1 hypothetical protein DCC35_10950 [Mangrovivirga cuniculi]